MQNPFFNQIFCVFRTTFTMLSHSPPASTRRGKGLTKTETTTLLKAVERILPIDAEGWTEVHDIFNSKHSSQGVEGLKKKFNKLANKPVPTGNPNIPFCSTGARPAQNQSKATFGIQETTTSNKGRASSETSAFVDDQ